MARFDRRRARRHIVRAVHPDVEDARRQGNGASRREQFLDGAEHVATDVGNPERAVAELLELRGRLARLGALGVKAQLAAPDADAADLHAHRSPAIATRPPGCRSAPRGAGTSSARPRA